MRPVILLSFDHATPISLKSGYRQKFSVTSLKLMSRITRFAGLLIPKVVTPEE